MGRFMAKKNKLTGDMQEKIRELRHRTDVIYTFQEIANELEKIYGVKVTIASAARSYRIWQLKNETSNSGQQQTHSTSLKTEQKVITSDKPALYNRHASDDKTLEDFM